jgi:bifunctional UDP-N-acetylglucosamine pyrophosphorylase/glucosamine-1-phosphate N-acetyltransferase
VGGISGAAYFFSPAYDRDMTDSSETPVLVQTSRPLSAIVLAAGLGTRMKSSIPKVAHLVAGRPMIAWVIHALRPLGCDRIIVVVGYGKELVASLASEHLPFGTEVAFVEQLEPAGTGHAAKVGVDWLEQNAKEPGGHILIVHGDSPLITAETLAELVVYCEESDAAGTILTANVDDPTDYGRVIRGDDGRVLRIVEERDCGPDEAAITEINAGIYCFDRPVLTEALQKLSNDNAQGEYYLPDVVEYVVEAGNEVQAIDAPPEEVLGVNTRSELAETERLLRDRINRAHMAAGVTLVDPATTYIGAEVSIARDTRILPGTIIEGESSIGEGCEVGPYTRIVDSVMGSRCVVTYAVICEAQLGNDVTVGPFAYLRPGSRLADGVHIGTSVETKSASIGEGSKIPHLSYIGDAEVGARVNIGAGTITCNFDGEHKHKTVIEDDAKIGSDTMLVAPVRIGKGAYTAAGSSITVDVPPGDLGVARQRQRNVAGWVKRRRSSKAPESNQEEETGVDG